jgi:hypothetical protein
MQSPRSAAADDRFPLPGIAELTIELATRDSRAGRPADERSGMRALVRASSAGRSRRVDALARPLPVDAWSDSAAAAAVSREKRRRHAHLGRMPPVFEIVTERLALRPVLPAGLPAFVAYRSDREVARYQSWDATYSMVNAERFLATQHDVEFGEPGEWVQLAAIDRFDGSLAGRLRGARR